MGNWQSVEQPQCICVAEFCKHESGCKNAAGYDPDTEEITLCGPCIQNQVDKTCETLSRVMGTRGPDWKQTRCPCINMHGKCEHEQRCWVLTNINVHNNPALCENCSNAIQGVMKAAENAQCDYECMDGDDNDVAEGDSFDD